MSRQYKFNYTTYEDINRDSKKLDIKLPQFNNLELFAKGLYLNGKRLGNRLAVHPMEGTDANKNGSPSELTLRRYKRYARGGSGLIWVEAVAVNKQGRANQHQLMITEKNIDKFTELVDIIKSEARENYDFTPYVVLQLTHSGRFGENKTILFHNKYLDRASGVSKDLSPITDRELGRLETDFVEATKLAREAGFDAVDIKSCHRYLLSEMLAAHIREGKYGGSYQNRTRFIKNVIEKIDNKINIQLAIRLNIYDAIPYPYGWGTDKKGNMDLQEPKRLVRELEDMGVKLFNITASTPYLKPHINRPYDSPGNMGYDPPEHPLKGVGRLSYLSKIISDTLNNAYVLGTGFSWLRQFAPHFAAGMLEKGWADIIGFGREAFAYPEFARDLLQKGKFKKDRVCLTCGRCTDLKTAHKITGCVVRDKDIYLQPYKELMEEIRKKRMQGGG